MRKSVLLTLLSFCYCIGIGIFNTALAFDTQPYIITHQPTYTAELKPMPSDSYQLAKATFLPDAGESKFSGYKLDGDYNQNRKCNSGYHEKNGYCEKDCIANSCSGYSLNTCPANAICSSCTEKSSDCSTGITRYNVNSCSSGYEWNGSQCESSCSNVYAYYCNREHELGGIGTPCGGKYEKCTCANGYVWWNFLGLCENCNAITYTCTGPHEYPANHAAICNGKYNICNCKYPYTWSGSLGCYCDAKYKYTCNKEFELKGNNGCDGKYTACNCQDGYVWSPVFGTCIRG